MKINVYNNHVDVTYQDDFQKAQDYFKRHGVQMDFTFNDVCISGYKVQKYDVGQNGYRYLITGHESKVPLSNGEVSIFMFNGHEFPLATMPTSNVSDLPNGILVNLMAYREGDISGELYNTLIHELMHALNHVLIRKGVTLYDPMDAFFENGQWKLYYKNDQPEAPDSNFGHAWAIMKPYLYLLNDTMPQATIIRTPNAKETPGVLTATKGGATFVCKTLELPWLNNARNISCIPTGTYTVKHTRSLKYPLGTYEIQNVPNRSGIRLDVGNYAYKAYGSPDIEGCILLGNAFQDINGDKVPDVVNSKITVNAFEGFMGKQDFILTIK